MSLRIHADFAKRVVIEPQDYQWVASPMPGVERMMLDRIGDEVGRATSLVRYAPNSTFSPHIHDGGEEYLVLHGTLADEHGNYPKGTYVRNPVGSKHSPKIGPEGAMIFVKLHQFAADDTEAKVLNTRSSSWSPGVVPGLDVLPLHEHAGEHVALVKWAANTHFNQHQHWGGEEILVLDGTLYDEHGAYPKGTWLRSPHLSQHTPYSKNDGALIYVKVGHLH